MKIQTRVPGVRTFVAAGVAAALALSSVPVCQALAAESQDAPQVRIENTQLVQNLDEFDKAVEQARVTFRVENMTTGEKAVVKAKEYRGIPYVAGGSTPSGFDCSGFTQYVYGKVGVKLTHNSQAQYNECDKKVARDDLKKGDLVFFGDSTSSITHVGMYVGNGKYIHSPQTGDVVSIDSLAHRTNFVGAARPY